MQSGWSGPYLSTGQFAASYGQSPQVIAGIVAYLHHFGISTDVYPDGLDIASNGTAAQFNRALSVSLTNYRLLSTPTNRSERPRQVVVYGSQADPRMPIALASPILAILGLSNYSAAQSEAISPVARQINRSTSSSGGLPAGVGRAPADFSSDYNLAPLQKRRAQGQGTTIGIVTLVGLDPGVPFVFWNNYLKLNEPASRLSLVPVDGGSSPPSLASGSVEPDLDVEQAGAIAPRANVRVYEAPGSDAGFVDAIFSAAAENVADTVSISFGESEAFIQDGIAGGSEPSAFESAFDEAYLELAAQGQSSFTSSGDQGPYEADNSFDLQTTNLTPLVPEESPYTTSAGGTTLAGAQTFQVFDAEGNPTSSTETASIPAERTWSWDYLWPLYRSFGYPSEAAAATDPGLLFGSGGGYSALEPRPSYQRGVSAFNDRRYLTPTGFVPAPGGLIFPTGFSFTSTPPLRAGQEAAGRAVPDISTDGDPETGYAVYDPGFVGGFALYGGTSIVAPQLNASAAVIDSYLGHRTGFWNPDLYALANSANSPLTPLNDTTAYEGVRFLSQTDAGGQTTALAGEFSNNNTYYTGEPGARWNPGSGLGIPNLAALATDLSTR